VFDSTRGIYHDPVTGEVIALDRPRDDPQSGLVVEHISIDQAIKEAELSGRRLPEPGPWKEAGKGARAAKEEAEQQSAARR
jgi:hypothetical protein